MKQNVKKTNSIHYRFHKLQFGNQIFRYFFVTLNYWLGSESKEGPMDGINLSESELELGGEGGEAKKIEKEPSHLHLGVSVQVTPTILYLKLETHFTVEAG